MEIATPKPSPAVIGSVTVAFTTFVPALIYAFIDAYFSPEPHWKFGRDGIFQLSLFVLFWLTICNLVAFLITVPLYYRWQLKRSRGRIIAHSVIGAVLAYASFSSGIPARLERFLPHGTLSNTGVTEIIVLTAATAIAPFLTVLVLHLIFDRFRTNVAISSWR